MTKLKLGMTIALLAITCAIAMPASAQTRQTVQWSGRVDDTTIVSIHGSIAQVQVVSGRAMDTANTQFNGHLPTRHPIDVTLDSSSGRGHVRLIQQPNESNGFTAEVRIRDPQHGAGDYSFTLSWDRAASDDEDRLTQ